MGTIVSPCPPSTTASRFSTDTPAASALSERIETWTHTVEIVATSKKALEKLRQKEFHLMLLDIFLPDCMGHEMIPKFKEVWPDIKIVTMTGENSRELESRVRQEGVICYMIKSICSKSPKEILNHISKKLKGNNMQNV